MPVALAALRQVATGARRSPDFLPSTGWSPRWPTTSPSWATTRVGPIGVSWTGTPTTSGGGTSAGPNALPHPWATSMNSVTLSPHPIEAVISRASTSSPSGVMLPRTGAYSDSRSREAARYCTVLAFIRLSSGTDPGASSESVNPNRSTEVNSTMRPKSRLASGLTDDSAFSIVVGWRRPASTASLRSALVVPDRMPIRRQAVARRSLLIEFTAFSSIGSGIGMYRAMSGCDRSRSPRKTANPAMTRLDASRSTSSGTSDVS